MSSSQQAMHDRIHAIQMQLEAQQDLCLLCGRPFEYLWQAIQFAHRHKYVNNETAAALKTINRAANIAKHEFPDPEEPSASSAGLVSPIVLANPIVWCRRCAWFDEAWGSFPIDGYECDSCGNCTLTWGTRAEQKARSKQISFNISFTAHGLIPPCTEGRSSPRASDEYFETYDVEE